MHFLPITDALPHMRSGGWGVSPCKGGHIRRALNNRCSEYRGYLSLEQCSVSAKAPSIERRLNFTLGFVQRTNNLNRSKVSGPLIAYDYPLTWAAAYSRPLLATKKTDARRHPFSPPRLGQCLVCSKFPSHVGLDSLHDFEPKQ